MATMRTQSIVLSGPARTIAEFLDRERTRVAPFETSVSYAADGGRAIAVLRGGADLPYRTVGGLIYTAQRAGLKLEGWAWNPRPCPGAGMDRGEGAAAPR